MRHPEDELGDLAAVKGLALGAAIGAWIWAGIAALVYLV